MMTPALKRIGRIAILILFLLLVAATWLFEPKLVLYVAIAVPLIALPAYMLAKALKWPPL